MTIKASPSQELAFTQIGPAAPRGFDCGRSEQNEFLHNCACTYHEIGASLTYLAHRGSECVGFITLTSDSIELYRDERPPEVAFPRLPALKIAQMGVEKGCHGQDIGSDLVAFALFLARAVRSQVGCVYLSVDAKPDVTGFYEKLGFKRNRAELRRRRDREGDRYSAATAPVSMRFDIREPGET